MSARACTRPWLWLLAMVAAACASSAVSNPPTAANTPTAPAQVLHYEVTVPQSLQHLDVRLCVQGARPAQMIAARADMADAMTRMSIEGPAGSRALGTGGSTVELGALDPDDCIHYTIATRGVGGFVPAMQRIGDALLTDTSVWLWRPAGWDSRTRLTARFVLPDGYSVSLPWERSGAGFGADASALGFAGNAVFGRLDIERFVAAGAQIEVVVPTGLQDGTRAVVAPWIESAVDAAAGAFGRFPADRLQVVLVPRAGLPEAIGFGLMRRGGGPSARLVVASDAQLSDLRGAWTAIHEFSHLFHHFVEKSDAWLSEGIATYYQEVLRARAGLLTPQQAWQRIYSGALKGRGSDRSLGAESAVMFAEYNFSRVYWGGAAIALQADVALRSHPQRPSTLDGALRQLTGCCGVIHRPWSCARTMGQLDQLTGTQVFAGLLERARFGRMPDLTATFALLGVRVEGDDVTFYDAPLSHIRNAIMAGPPPHADASPARD